jgi:predicted transposase YbfD/YdcC
VEYSTAQSEIQIPLSEDGYVFEVGSLYERLQTLTDSRRARGKRFELALVLLLAILAKLTGSDRPCEIADWVRGREEVLTAILKVSRPHLPSHSTYRRVFRAVQPEELQGIVRGVLEQSRDPAGQVLIAIDGKTLRGTLSPGQTSGVHLLTAYVPGQALVLLQVAVDAKTNEITAAPKLLKALNLQGKIVMGDALHTQRDVSVQIVQARGEYIWYAKDNQPDLQQEIQDLFEPEHPLPGHSLAPVDFEAASTTDKGHGRLEKRTLTTSSLLQGYSDWPYVAQVFKLERRVVCLRSGEVHYDVVYGLSSLTRVEAGPVQLLKLTRDYWGIENELHYRRDRTLHEDATRMKHPRQAEVVACLNNLIIGLICGRDRTNLAAARRYYESRLAEALALVLQPPARL